MLKNEIIVGLTVGILCFGIGAITFSDTKNVKILKEENSKYKSEIDEKDETIAYLNNKIKEAKPWFDEQEKKAEENKLLEERTEKEKNTDELLPSVSMDEAINFIKKELEEENSKKVDTNSIKSKVQSIIEKEIKDEDADTTINSVNINENMGTDSSDDVIVLLDLTFTRLNKEKTTMEMLEMYSDIFAKKLLPELADGSEIAFFWTAEYTGIQTKYSYIVKSGTLYRQ